MENKKPLSTFREVHHKVQEALSHAREVREKDAELRKKRAEEEVLREGFDRVSKRRLRIVSKCPLLGVCEYCNMQFSGGDSRLTKSSVQEQFEAHKCKRQDFAQNAARIVRKATSKP